MPETARGAGGGDTDSCGELVEDGEVRPDRGPATSYIAGHVDVHVRVPPSSETQNRCRHRYGAHSRAIHTFHEIIFFSRATHRAPKNTMVHGHWHCVRVSV